MTRIVVALLFLMSISCYSANPVLTDKDKAKIASYELDIAVGDGYLKESDNYLKLINNITRSGKYREKDSIRLTNKHMRTRLLAFDYLEGGYNGLFKVYTAAVEGYNEIAMNSKANDLLAIAATSHSNGRKNFRKVPDEMDKRKAVSSMNMAIEFEKTSIARLKDAVDLLEGGVGRSEKVTAFTAPTIAPTVLKTDSLLQKPTVSIITAPVVPFAIIDSSALVSNDVKSYDNATTFFSVQINASKTRLAPAQLATYYSGKYKVVLTEADGYFRYSVGKFLSVEDAQKVIVQEKIKGYIVGYLNNSRVSVAEVTKALTK